MGRKEFEWDGDDFHSVWDDFTPLRKAVPPARITDQESWGTVLPEVRVHQDLTADVTLPNGYVLQDVPVFIPQRREVIEALGGRVIEERPAPDSTWRTWYWATATTTGSDTCYFRTPEEPSIVAQEEESHKYLIPEPPIVYDPGPTWDHWDAIIPPIKRRVRGLNWSSPVMIRAP